MRRWLLLLIVGAFAWAPVQAQVSSRPVGGRTPLLAPTQTPGDYSKIRNVVVLSGIGSTLTVQKRRPIRWTTEERAIDDWQLDALVVSRVREYLGDRFAFKDVAYDARAMGRLPAGFLRDTNPTVRRFFDSIPKEGVDAYIIVRRQSLERNSTVPRTSPGLALYGLVDDFNPVPVEVANYAIDIVRPARLEVIATASSQIRYREGGEAYFAEIDGDDELKSSAEAELSDAQRTRLRSDFQRLLSLSLIDTLRALDLGAALPPVGGTRTVSPIAPDRAPFANIRRIGVVSAIGDRFHFGRAGRTVFGDSNASLPVEDWGVDRHVEDVARRILSERFEVKDVAVDRVALARSNVRNGHLKFNPVLHGVEKTSDVDAYVLFLKFPMELGYENYEGLGIGLFNHEGPRSGVKQNSLFAHYAVLVVDVNKLEIVRAITGTMSPERPIPRPAREIDASLWTDSVTRLSADQKDAIRQSLLELLPESIEETLLRDRSCGECCLLSPGRSGGRMFAEA